MKLVYTLALGAGAARHEGSSPSIRTMSFLYHAVPADMIGSVLYPLNVLKDMYPERYSAQVAKYEGRAEVMEQPVPPLDCLWNDVIHLTAIPPRAIKDALLSAGSADFQRLYYQIDPSLLEVEKTTIYLYAHRFKSEKFNVENFAVYSPSEIHRYAQLPTETKNYYKEELAAGRRPLSYHRVPHILYKAQLDISRAPIITI